MKKVKILTLIFNCIVFMVVQNNFSIRNISPEGSNSYYDNYFKDKYNEYNKLPSNDLNNNNNNNNNNNTHYYFDDYDYYQNYHKFKYYDDKYDYFEHNYYNSGGNNE